MACVGPAFRAAFARHRRRRVLSTNPDPAARSARGGLPQLIGLARLVVLARLAIDAGPVVEFGHR